MTMYRIEDERAALEAAGWTVESVQYEHSAATCGLLCRKSGREEYVTQSAEVRRLTESEPSGPCGMSDGAAKLLAETILDGPFPYQIFADARARYDR
jgi:hypothetical protein